MNNNEWITDRRPTEQDACKDADSVLYECVIVPGYDYKLYRKWYNVKSGEAWKRIETASTAMPCAVTIANGSRWNCFVEDDDGQVLMGTDVAKLEAEHAQLKAEHAQLKAEHAKLEAINAQLLEVLEPVRAVLPPLVSLDNAKKMLDAAIAKAKEVMP